MRFRDLKLELFYLHKAFFVYKKGFLYFKNKYLLAPRILKSNKILEKPITNNDLSIHLLTCHRDMVMLIWSLVSFYKVATVIGELFIHDDGSLTTSDKSIIKKLFPSAKIINTLDFAADFAAELNGFPIIKSFRTKYPHYVLLKKLIDPYFVSDKRFHLIIDSDLLCFKKPQEIEAEISASCNQSLMMFVDVICPVYFKKNKLDEELAKFNSGVVLYRRDNFNLEKLSYYLKNLDLSNPANSHFIEQAGYSYSLENLKPLPKDIYIVKGKVDEKVVLKHYTSPRRPLFYIEGIEILKKYHGL